MKAIRSLLIILVVILIADNASAWTPPENTYKQARETNFGFGALIPADGETGWLIHGAYHWRLDNSVFHGPSLNLYNHKFTQRGEVWGQVQPGWTQSTYTTEFESRLTLLSPQYNLGCDFDLLGVKNLTEFVKVSLGLDMLWGTEKNFTANVSNTDFYFDWCWNINSGAKLKLGDRTWLTAELGYHRGVPSRKAKPIANLPTRTDINMSGFVMKLGINYFFWTNP